MSLSSLLCAPHCAGDSVGGDVSTSYTSERGVGCLPNLDPGQNTPSWCMQVNSISHTHHPTNHLQRVLRVVYVALLGELWSRSVVKRCNCISMILCAILRYCQTTRSWDDVYHPPATVEISTDRSTDRPCALDMCNTARSFTHQSNTCESRRWAFLNFGWIEQISCTPLPATLYNLASQNSGLSTNFKILR